MWRLREGFLPPQHTGRPRVVFMLHWFNLAGTAEGERDR